MTNSISHAGIVDSLNEGVVHVRITQQSACASCKLSGKCTSAESKEKMIDVYTKDATLFSVGESVNVIASSAVGAKAIVYGFVLPLVIMMLSVIASLLAFGLAEPVSALIGLASLVPYYTLLYLMRNRLQKELVFHITRG